MKPLISCMVALLGGALLSPTSAQAATFLVSNVNDSGEGSFRQALLNANAAPDEDVIAFDTTFFASPRTLALTSGELLISQPVSVVGPQARLLTINSGGTSRIFNVASGTVRISGLRATNGKSESGGGIKVSGGATLYLKESVLSSNNSTADGGAISNGGSLFVQGSTISGNTAGSEGGAISNVGSLNLENSTLAENSAPLGGAIASASGGTVIALNSTIALNSATTSGGGIENSNGGPLQLSNSIVAGNSAPTGADINGSLSTNERNIINQTLEQAGLYFKGLGDNGGPTPTIELVAGSPAIDGGNSTLTTDQRGLKRPFGGAPDIGAYEFIPDPTGPAALVVTTEEDVQAKDGRISLREAILWANYENGFPGADTITFAIPGEGPHTILLRNQLPELQGTVTLDNGGEGAAPVTLKRSSTLDVGLLVVGYSGIAQVKGLSFIGGYRIGGSNGGAIANFGILGVDRCSFIDNYATYGGALANAPSGTLSVSRSSFARNEGANGGAIVNFGGLSIDACTFNDNTSRYGGGLFNNPQSPGATMVRNSTFSQNKATVNGIGKGGAVCAESGVLSLESCTITGNQASLTGGGALTSVGRIEAHNCIIAGNSSTDVDSNGDTPRFTSKGYNLIGSGNATAAFAASGDRVIGSASPEVGPLQFNGGPTETMRLLPYSAAINAGDPVFDAAANAFDQRGEGFARVKFGRVDIGAFEAQTLSNVITLSESRIAENQAKGTVVGTFATTGEATNAPYSYSLVDGEGSTDNRLFSIEGDNLLGDQFDFEVASKYSIRVRSTNAQGQSVEAVFIITVLNRNEAPTATVVLTPATATTNTLLKATAKGTDPEGDEVSFVYSWSKNGVVLNNETSSTLDLSKAGNGDKGDTITVEVTPKDAELAGSSASASVVIGNSAPVLTATTFAGRENQVLSSRIEGQDADNEPLTYSTLTAPRYGTLQLQSNGAFIYTPRANWSGNDSFVARANDGSGANVRATFTVAVKANNRVPVAAADVVRGYEDVPLSIAAATLLRNDSNGENRGVVDPLRIIKVVPVAGFPGSLKLDVAKQLIVFTPKLNWSGTTSFAYTVQDSGGAIATAQVTLQIAAVNDAPVANAGRMVVTSGTLSEFPLSGSDIEGDALTFALSGAPSNGAAQVVKVGTRWLLRYRSAVGFVGVAQVKVVARDGRLNSAPATITFTVKANNAPQLLGLNPNRGYVSTGTNVVFEQRVNDSNGVTQLDAVSLLLSNVPTSPNASRGAAVWFDAVENRFTLTGDDGRTTFAPVALGQTLENSQVKVTLGTGDVVRTGNSTLTLRWRVTFKPNFVGPKSLWGRVEDLGGLSAGFTKYGDITVQTPSTSSSAVSVSSSAPNS